VVGHVTTPGDQEFGEFVRAVEPSLRRALFAVLGAERGREATAEALAWAWEHWDRVVVVDNPTGYLFRVGQSRSRTRKVRTLHARNEWSEPLVEPELTRALADLSEAQRVAVILVHGFGWTMREVAELNGTHVSSVQTHLARGLRKLRAALEVEEHA
jgi:DNA-directed RNA polymerase specialized sigma24 family protein